MSSGMIAAMYLISGCIGLICCGAAIWLSRWVSRRAAPSGNSRPREAFPKMELSGGLNPRFFVGVNAGLLLLTLSLLLVFPALTVGSAGFSGVSMGLILSVGLLALLTLLFAIRKKDLSWITHVEEPQDDQK